MITKTFIAKNKELTINLPREYINKEIEIVIDIKHKSKINFDKYFGIMKNNNDIEDEIKNIREEWNNRL